MQASLRLIDNSVVLSSGDPLMEDWESVVEQGSIADLKLRKALAPDAERHSIDELVEDFLLSGASYLAYESGVSMSLKPFPRNGNVIELRAYHGSMKKVYVGLDLNDIAVLAIDGVHGSGRSTFVKDFFPRDITSVVDFAKIDFTSLSPSTRKDYGNSVALSFVRNTNLRYLVIDHFTPSSANKRKHHPALYHDMLMQIVDSVSMFRSLGKVLVLAEAASDLATDRTIVLSDEKGQYRFSMGDVVFPARKR